MREAIKVGDIFLLYENQVNECQGVCYSFGKKLGHFFRQLSALFKALKVVKQEQNVETIIWNRRIDYSLYEIPAVYRKWR